ncbi:hypothetical protein MRX96_016040 [Rhipicephalus microplus]
MEKQDPPIHRSPSREQTHGSSQRKSRSKSKERGRKSRSKSKERGRRSSASKSKDRGRRSDSTTQDDAWPGLSPSPALNNSSVNSHQEKRLQARRPSKKATMNHGILAARTTNASLLADGAQKQQKDITIIFVVEAWTSNVLLRLHL